MNIDIASLGILITVLLALFGLSAWAGRLSERVGNNRYDIELQREDFNKMMDKFDRIIMDMNKNG